MENVIVPIPTSLKVKKKALKTLQVLYVAIIVILLYSPVLFIMIESVNSSVSNYGFGEFTFEWYQKMLYNADLKEAVVTTFSITALSTLISTVLGTAFAIGINAMDKKHRKTLIMLNNIPILNADIVSAIFLFIIFKTVGSILNIKMPLGYVTLLLSHIFFSLPYVVLSVLPKLKEIDENLFDAALDLGCKPNKALAKVIIPAIMGGVFSGAVLAFTMSIDDFTISYFVKGAEITNLSTWINSIRTVRYGKLQIASAFYSIFTVVAFVILIGYNVITAKRREKRMKRVG